MAGEIQTVSDNDNKTVDIKDFPPPPPTPGEEVTIRGSQVTIKKDESGRATALILSGKLILLPPHAADDLLPLMEPAKTILIKGIQRSEADGFVNINGLPLVRPDEITIDSIKYLVR